MAFWSSETIKKRLNLLIKKSDGAMGDPAQIDCCAYTLTVGPEAYITPNTQSVDSKGHTKFVLSEKEHFQIPTGQFAYLITEEYISVPRNAIAFISIKATTKFKGLINVSGFHVDPGWNGRLIFSVFNAGPNNITLARGDPLFLIWFADLDIETEDYKRDTEQEDIPSKFVEHIDGEVYSPVVVKKKLYDMEKLIHKMQLNNQLYMAGVLVTVLIAIVVSSLYG